jgi:hypothetical protein
MKKQKLNVHVLQLKKVTIADLPYKIGGKPIISGDTSCCSEPPLCPKTVTTRPDSLGNS